MEEVLDNILVRLSELEKKFDKVEQRDHINTNPLVLPDDLYLKAADSHIYFGASDDVNLYRSAARTLQLYSAGTTTPTEFQIFNNFSGQAGSNLNPALLRLGTASYYATIGTTIFSTYYGDNVHLDFYTPYAQNDNTQTLRMRINPWDGYVGIGEPLPAAKLDICQSNSAAAVPVLELDQDDIDDVFINFVGTSAADTSRSITTKISTWTHVGGVRVEINGTQYWIPMYTIT